jgi:anti-anti-sigma factor
MALSSEGKEVAGLGSLWDSEHPSPRKVTHLHDDSITVLTPFLIVQKEIPANMNPMQERSLKIEDVPGSPDGPHILRLSGPLILTTLSDFQSKVRADWSHNLILDFTNVPYLDSAGIGALAWVHVRHHKDSNGVSLVGVGERVHEALKIAHLDQFFRFFDSLSDAQAKRL